MGGLGGDPPGRRLLRFRQRELQLLRRCGGRSRDAERKEVSSGRMPVLEPVGHLGKPLGGQGRGTHALQGLRAAPIVLPAGLAGLARTDIRAIRGPRSARHAAGSARQEVRSTRCEARCARHIAGSARSIPRSASHVAGSASHNPRSARRAAGSARRDPRSARHAAGSASRDPRNARRNLKLRCNHSGEASVSSYERMLDVVCRMGFPQLHSASHILHSRTKVKQCL